MHLTSYSYSDNMKKVCYQVKKGTYQEHSSFARKTKTFFFNSLVITSEIYVGKQMHTHTHTHTKFPGQISVLCRFQTVPRAIKLNLSIHLTHFPRVDFDQRFHFLHYQLLCIYAHTLGHFICVGLVISHQLSNVSPQSPCAFRVETVGHIFLSFCHLCCLSLVHFNIVF